MDKLDNTDFFNNAIIDSNKLQVIFVELNDELYREGISLDLCIYGVSLMTLLYNSRESTRDIDCIFSTEDSITLSFILQDIGQRNKLNRDWFNSEVKSPLSKLSKEDILVYKTFSNLHINVCSKEQLLAMKILASRPFPSNDFSDSILLCRDLGVTSLSILKEVISPFISFNLFRDKHYDFIESLSDEFGGDWSWR